MEFFIENLDKIKSGLFLDQLKFGCTKEEFIKVVGEPESTTVYNEGTEEEYLELIYGEDIYVSFDKSENDRFTIFEIYETVVKIDGLEISGGKYEEVAKKLKEAGWKFKTSEKSEGEEYFIDVDEKGIMIFFDEEDDCLSVSLSPVVKVSENGEEQIEWPS